jgi:NhaA family Na+:H+ antiporter
MPPVQRVQEALHPRVAFVIMPLFALANAGVNFHGAQLSDAAVVPVVYGVVTALVFGKPIGVVLATFLLVRTGLCKLPEQVTWRGVMLVGLLAGIGFTMSIFIAGLAHDEERLLAAAKLSVLCGSTVSAVVGLLWDWSASEKRERVESRSQDAEALGRMDTDVQLYTPELRGMVPAVQPVKCFRCWISV